VFPRRHWGILGRGHVLTFDRLPMSDLQRSWLIGEANFEIPLRNRCHNRSVIYLVRLELQRRISLSHLTILLFISNRIGPALLSLIPILVYLPIPTPSPSLDALAQPNPHSSRHGTRTRRLNPWKVILHCSLPLIAALLIRMGIGLAGLASHMCVLKS
jgi:hypothetical protein